MAMPGRCARALLRAHARPSDRLRRGRGLPSGVAIRSIASLSISFGLVSIPVKVYAATESSAAVRFKLLSRGGARVRRQYVADPSEPPLVLEDVDEDPGPEARPNAREDERAASREGGRDERRAAASPAAAASAPLPAEPPAASAPIAPRSRPEEGRAAAPISAPVAAPASSLR